MKNFFLLFGTVLVSLFASAQKNNKFPAKVKTKGNTELTGSVVLKSSALTPQLFEFWDNNSPGNNTVLTPGNTETIEIADSVIYSSANLKIYTNQIENGSLETTPDEPFVQGDFFIERLIKGNILSLYLFTDGIKTHFIIEDASGNFQSLRYVKYIDNFSFSGSFKEVAFYKNQLLSYAGEKEKAKNKIMSAAYSIAGLTTAVSSINDQNTFSKRAVAETSKHLTFYPFAGAGIALTTVEFAGIPQRLVNIDFPFSASPLFTAGVEMQAGKNKNIIASIFATFYTWSITGTNSYKNSNGNKIEDKYEMKASPVTFGLAFNYGFAHIKDIKLTAGIGYSFMLNNITKNNFTTTDVNANGSTVKLTEVPISSNSGHYFADADIFINKRISVLFIYSPIQDFSGLNVSSFKNSLFGTAVKFRF